MVIEDLYRERPFSLKSENRIFYMFHALKEELMAAKKELKAKTDQAEKAKKDFNEFQQKWDPLSNHIQATEKSMAFMNLYSNDKLREDQINHANTYRKLIEMEKFEELNKRDRIRDERLKSIIRHTFAMLMYYKYFRLEKNEFCEAAIYDSKMEEFLNAYKD